MEPLAAMREAIARVEEITLTDDHVVLGGKTLLPRDAETVRFGSS